MTKQRQSSVDLWLDRETLHVRKALESASRYFDGNDSLTVNTLEAIYGQESSFGAMLGKRGATGPAGHFQFEVVTAKRYGLIVSKTNDQRFDIDYASSEFATKSLANKKIKQKEPRKDRYRCAEGHWVTIDDRPVFICD